MGSALGRITTDQRNTARNHHGNTRRSTSRRLFSIRRYSNDKHLLVHHNVYTAISLAACRAVHPQMRRSASCVAALVHFFVRSERSFLFTLSTLGRAATEQVRPLITAR